MRSHPRPSVAAAAIALGLLAASSTNAGASPLARALPATAVAARASSGGACGPTAGAGEAPWPEFDGNGAHSGDGVGTTASARALRRLWETPGLDGAVYAQPLLAGGCLYVATENDTVYAFDARTGALRWRTHLAAPVTEGLPCGDINPSGITGTPVLDPSAGVLWAVVLTDGPGGVEHELVALQATNGRVVRRQKLAVPGRNPAAEQQRSALVLANSNVYVAFGGLYGDCGNYVGAVASVPAAGGAARYWEVPTARQGGIWEPGGPDVLANGDILLADGNGAGSQGQAFDGSDAVVELSPGLKMAQAFAPADWAQLNAADLDLGSTGPALVPGGMAVQTGKSGTAYLLASSHLGGVGGQVATVQACAGGGAFGADAVSGSTVYVPCQGGLVAVAVKGRSLHVIWRSGAGGAGSPLVAGGRVFEQTSGGALQAFDPANGAVLQTVSLGSPQTHFPWLVAVGAVLYAADGTKVAAFSGL